MFRPIPVSGNSRLFCNFCWMIQIFAPNFPYTIDRNITLLSYLIQLHFSVKHMKQVVTVNMAIIADTDMPEGMFIATMYYHLGQLCP